MTTTVVLERDIAAAEAGVGSAALHEEAEAEVPSASDMTDAACGRDVLDCPSLCHLSISWQGTGEDKADEPRAGL